MAVTLAEAKKNVQDALQAGVIDEFRKSSFLLDNLTFDDCVSPTGGGTTFSYGYTRLVTQPTADFRAVNEEYKPQEVTKQRYVVDLKIFGGTFQIDRVIAGAGGIVNEVTLQMQQKIKAASALFSDTVINGDSATNAKSFDGLNVALSGSDTEFNTDAVIDMSDPTKIAANADQFLWTLDTALAELDGTPTAIMGNKNMIIMMKHLAHKRGLYQDTTETFGKQVNNYMGIPLVDLGNKAGTNKPIVGNDAANGTSIYFARFGLDGFHAISPSGTLPINTWLPDFTTAGAVKTGEVEMMAAVALKATKAAGVLRKIKVKATGD